MPELIVRGQFVYKEYIPLSFTIHFQNGTLFCLLPRSVHRIRVTLSERYLPSKVKECLLV